MRLTPCRAPCGDSDYREAVKCYRQALRIDPDNLNILRDASLLQIQMRDHRGFMESRRRLLTLKSNLKTNWIGFAVAHHLNQNYDMVMHVLKMYEGTLAADKSKKPTRDYDSNEIALYGCNVLEEAGKLQEALEYLDSKRDKVLDTATYTERRGQLLVRLNRAAEAVPLFKSLIQVRGQRGTPPPPAPPASCPLVATFRRPASPV